MIPHSAREPTKPPKGILQVPDPPLITAVIVLTKELGHKLWVYDVVSSLEGLHHMEAAAAPAFKRQLELKLYLGGSIFMMHLKHLFINTVKSNMHL